MVPRQTRKAQGQEPKQQSAHNWFAGQKPHAAGTEEAGSDAHQQATLQVIQLDNNVVSEGWAAVGGHAAVIQQLKEMVLAPLQYPEVFKHMAITPPR